MSGAVPSVPVMADLSVRDHMMLDLEGSWWKYAGAKDTAIRERFSMTSTRYYVTLNALIERPEAEAAYPMVVRRLRRLREARRAHRTMVDRSFGL